MSYAKITDDSEWELPDSEGGTFNIFQDFTMKVSSLIIKKCHSSYHNNKKTFNFLINIANKRFRAKPL